MNALPAPPSRLPDVSDDFRDGPDPSLWVPSYLAHWTTPERSAARYATGVDGLHLRIDEDQPDWRPEDAPLRVSNLQTGSFSGPAGSNRGTHRHRPDGLTVRTPQPTELLWAPRRGRIDLTVSGSGDDGCMLAAWLVGTEHESPNDSGEIFHTAQAPDYPLFLMLDLFEIGPRGGRYPKTAVVHSVRGWTD